MFIKDTFKSGQTVVPVPLGIPMILKYNPKGILENCYVSNKLSDENPQEISSVMFDSLYESKVIPVKIPVTGGTTHVHGVMYTGKLYVGQGALPDCVLMDMTAEFTENPESFNFFAGSAESTCASLKGYLAVRKFLTMCRFNLLPSFIVPTPLNTDNFESALYSNYNFIKDLIIGYYIYGLDTFEVVDVSLNQFAVHTSTKYTDSYGNIKYLLKCHCEGCDREINVDYSTFLNFKITRGTFLILNDNFSILKSFGKLSESISRTDHCSVCGKLINVPQSGLVKCGDANCLSNMYPVFSHFINFHRLPELSYSAYTTLVQAKKLTELCDIFQVTPWKSYKLEVTLFQLLRSVIPSNVITSDSVLSMFSQHCNGNVNMFTYYLKNPHQIQQDFHLTGKELSKFIKWVSNYANYSMILHLLDSDNITVVDAGKKFSGAPIFRNKTIMITGKFIRGSYEDICAILASYSAKVVDHFSVDIDCVIVGSTLEDMNSIEINKAHALNKPVFLEDKFFQEYEIDKDIKENLL